MQGYSLENHSWKKFQIFDQNGGLTPLEKWKIFDFFKMTSLQSRIVGFPLKIFFNSIYIQAYFIVNHTCKKFQIFLPKWWVKPFGKMQIFHFFKMTSLQSSKACFLSKTFLNGICRAILQKTTVGRNSKFLTKMVG